MSPSSIQTVDLSYRGQAQHRARQFSVISCRENQTRTQTRGSILGVEGESDVLAGVIWEDEVESWEINLSKHHSRLSHYLDT